MIIKEYQNGYKVAKLVNAVKNKNYAVFAIGGGAINAVWTVSKNKILSKYITFYQCDNEPLGCGNDVFLGKQLAETYLKKENILAKASFHKAIVISTLGGGTGTGAAPVFSKYLFEKGIEVTNIVSLSFAFEGITKLEKCQEAVAEMSKYAKTTIIFNEEIYKTIFAGKKFKEFLSIFDGYIEKALFYAIGITNQKTSWYMSLKNSMHNCCASLSKLLPHRSNFTRYK